MCLCLRVDFVSFSAHPSSQKMDANRKVLIDLLLDETEQDVLLMEQEDFSTSSHTHRNRTYIRRDFEAGHAKLINDYFADVPRFNEAKFSRRFRMSREMFVEIAETLREANDFFAQKMDAVGKPGLSTFQKCTAAIRMLAYGTASDSVDEYLQIGDSTAMLCLKEFCATLIKCFGGHYLRKPTPADLKRLVQENEARGFPGMVASIDCWHWDWESCPVGLKGQFKGKEGKPTIILEAVASYDCHIWHTFFGCPGSLNDINVLDRSPLTHDIMNNNTLSLSYELNGKIRNQGYFLADGIYPSWPIFVKTISNPRTAKEKLFAKHQESARKDVERAFGIMTKVWLILKYPARLWNLDVLNDVIHSCIILHNMRIERRITIEPTEEDPPAEEAEIFVSFDEYCAKRAKIRDSDEYLILRQDIIDHLWLHHGNQTTAAD